VYTSRKRLSLGSSPSLRRKEEGLKKTPPHRLLGLKVRGVNGFLYFLARSGRAKSTDTRCLTSSSRETVSGVTGEACSCRKILYEFRLFKVSCPRSKPRRPSSLLNFLHRRCGRRHEPILEPLSRCSGRRGRGEDRTNHRVLFLTKGTFETEVKKLLLLTHSRTGVGKKRGKGEGLSSEGTRLSR